MSSPTPTPIDGELSLSDKSLTSIPEEIVKLYGTSITKLDLTGNQLTSCSSLTGFTCLHTLILDKNQLTSLADIPSSLKTVTTLWLNNNRISDLNAIVDEIKTKFPSLQYLSMLKNPACPDVYFSDDQVDAYQRYRCYIISHLSHLAYLDSTPVLPTERKEAELRGHLMKVAKPKNGIHDGEQTPDSPPRASRSAGASVVANSKPPRVATFLAKGKPRYDGTNSEGNRFICNEDL